MTQLLALENLFDQVSAAFTADEINALNTFGWRSKAQHLDSPLPVISWVPGDPSGSLGELGGARLVEDDGYPGARPLFLLGELFTVYISAHDPEDLEDERAQYHVTRLLYDTWLRAVYYAAEGNFVLLSQAWLTERTERRFGTTIRVVCRIDAPVIDALPDEPLVGGAFAGLSDVADVPAEADLTVKLNDEDDST